MKHLIKKLYDYQDTTTINYDNFIKSLQKKTYPAMVDLILDNDISINREALNKLDDQLTRGIFTLAEQCFYHNYRFIEMLKFIIVNFDFDINGIMLKRSNISWLLSLYSDAVAKHDRLYLTLNKFLIEQLHVDVNRIFYDSYGGETCMLALAGEYELSEVVDYLLLKGARVNLRFVNKRGDDTSALVSLVRDSHNGQYMTEVADILQKYIK